MIIRVFIVVAIVYGVESLGGRGSKSALNLVSARSSEAHALQATEPVSIWCTPDNPQVIIKSATFTHKPDNQKYTGVISPNKKNASYTFLSPSIKDAGEYVCELDTPHGKVNHKAYIYSRPIAHSKEHFTESEGREFHLESGGTAIDKDESVNLTCPVTGYPKPAVKWTKDGAPLALSKNVQLVGTTIKINKADYEDAGIYSCEAVNEFTVNQKTSKMLLIVDKMLTVKYEYAWVYPLLVIIGILFLLALIIITCELRKKKQLNRQQQRLQNQQLHNNNSKHHH